MSAAMVTSSWQWYAACCLFKVWMWCWWRSSRRETHTGSIRHTQTLRPQHRHGGLRSLRRGRSVSARSSQWQKASKQEQARICVWVSVGGSVPDQALGRLVPRGPAQHAKRLRHQHHQQGRWRLGLQPNRWTDGGGNKKILNAQQRRFMKGDTDIKTSYMYAERPCGLLFGLTECQNGLRLVSPQQHLDRKVGERMAFSGHGRGEWGEEYLAGCTLQPHSRPLSAGCRIVSCR